MLIRCAYGVGECVQGGGGGCSSLVRSMEMTPAEGAAFAEGVDKTVPRSITIEESKV